MHLGENPVWIESESRSIGTVKIPDATFDQMQSAPLFEVFSPVEARKQRILKEYGVFPKADLADCTKKIKKRLGNLKLTEALTALEENRMDDWLDILIEYYDKTYSFSMNERTPVTKFEVPTANDETPSVIARRLRELYTENRSSLTAANKIA
jgi:tRNA 2-selenouridine synthase